MKSKVITFFILSFALSLGLGLYLSHLHDQSHYTEVNKGRHHVFEITEKRFSYYLDGPLTVGLLAAKFFSIGNPSVEDYEQLSTSVLQQFPEILGLNILDSEGRITRVYPFESNKEALGKITQNLTELKTSLSKNEDFYFSEPGPLFQKIPGFAFYIPFSRQSKHAGWIAPVISSRDFFEKFKLSAYLQNYHLVITDKESGSNFFATSKLPKDLDKATTRHEAIIHGRPVILYCWPATPIEGHKFPLGYLLLICLVFASLVAYTYKLYLLRVQERRQLMKINTLLNYTAKEASETLSTLQAQMNLEGQKKLIEVDKVASYIAYVSNLLEQFSTTDNITRQSQHPQMDKYSIYPLLMEQINLFQPLIKEKKLKLKVDNSMLETFEVWSNKWLLSHSVLGNILRTVIQCAPENTEITIMLLKDNGFFVLSLQAEIDRNRLNRNREEILDRGLEIATEVIQISKGEIDIIEKGTHERTIALQFPNR